MWLVIKHKTTGMLSVVSREIREFQIQLWTCNGIIVPSIVLKEFETSEQASNFLIEFKAINELINNILEKDEEKFGSE